MDDVSDEEDKKGISMEEIEAVFRHCAKIIIEGAGLLRGNAESAEESKANQN